jgi:hypothetical protein
VLGRIYRNLAPLDPAGALRHEWVNARGAIARFDRGSIEIRVLDVQECPAADLAISTAIVAVVEALTAGDWSRPEEQRDIETAALNAILEETTARAEAATSGTRHTSGCSVAHAQGRSRPATCGCT